MKTVLTLLFLFTASVCIADECRVIDSIPVSIDSPGSYCLAESHGLNMQYGSAITIRSGNVHIDFGGHTLYNSYGNRTSAFGIRADDLRNLSITGGTLSGFHTGIYLGSSNDGCLADTTGPYRVADMAITQAYRSGIFAQGCHIVIRNNHVADIGKGSRDTGLGIYAEGTQTSLVDNDVQGLVGDWQTSIGIWLVSGTGIVEGNRVQSAPNGIVMPIGGLVPYRENSTIEISRFAYEGGQDAGDNF